MCCEKLIEGFSTFAIRDNLQESVILPTTFSESARHSRSTTFTKPSGKSPGIESGQGLTVLYLDRIDRPKKMKIMLMVATSGLNWLSVLNYAFWELQRR
jgi:hypothetical protein